MGCGTQSPSDASAKAKPTSIKSKWKALGVAILLTLWVVAGIVFSELMVGYLIVSLCGGKALDSPVVSGIYALLSYTLAITIVVPHWFEKFRANHSRKAPSRDVGVRQSWREGLGLRGLPTWTDIGLSVVGLIVSLALAACLMNLFSVFSWFDASKTQDIGFNSLTGGTDRVIAFLTVVVLAPIAEEILFRGFLYGELREKFAGIFSKSIGVAAAIFLTSVAFGLIHFQWNVGVTVFAMSVAMCVLREITGTIYAGILLHMLKNALAFYVLYVAGFM